MWCGDVTLRAFFFFVLALQGGGILKRWINNLVWLGWFNRLARDALEFLEDAISLVLGVYAHHLVRRCANWWNNIIIIIHLVFRHLLCVLIWNPLSFSLLLIFHFERITERKTKRMKFLCLIPLSGKTERRRQTEPYPRTQADLITNTVILSEANSEEGLENRTWNRRIRRSRTA